VGDVVVAAGLLALAATYATGWRSQGTRADPRRLSAFLVAFVTLLVALLSPLATAADTSLTAHMVQHVLLIAVVPPLLLASRAGSVTMLALSPPARRRVARATAPVMRAARHPFAVVVAVAVQLGAMAIWHAPDLYDAAATHETLHAFEHLTLLLTALLLWWTVALAMRARPAIAVTGLFVASFGCTALGAAMVLAGHTWYPLYARAGGHSALADQQLAGVVMWAFANFVLVIATCSIVAIWLGRLDRTSPSRSVTVTATGEPAP
jgi:putative membrane protein